MADPVMSDLYYNLLTQIEQMTLVDLGDGSAGRLDAAVLSARMRGPREPFSATDQAVAGEILYVRHGFIHGWAIDKSDPSRKVGVKAIVKGTTIATAIADQPLPDLLKTSLPRHASPRAGFVLRAFLPNRRVSRTKLDVVLGEFETVLAKGLEVYPPSATLRHTSYEAYAEPSQTGTAQGWAWCPSKPDQTVDVVIMVNGIAVARVAANRYREDLAEAGIGNGEHGFAVPIAGQFIDQTEKSIEIVIAENGVPLKHSPMIIRGRQIVARPPSRWRSMRNAFVLRSTRKP